ncbi:MAG: hypothetical protein K2G36_09515 [Ruminococcus sp.]|nr:hypothetical protein [Ruminococcus sp.]
MKIFRKNKQILPVPEGFTPDDIKIEASICTGEKIIGFYDKSTRKLFSAELVRNDEDISRFYRKYGIK